jgi:hypothetical protein
MTDVGNGGDLVVERVADVAVITLNRVMARGRGWYDGAFFAADGTRIASLTQEMPFAKGGAVMKAMRFHEARALAMKPQSTYNRHNS